MSEFGAGPTRTHSPSQVDHTAGRKGVESVESIGRHKGKKVSKSKNPFKYILKVVTSQFTKPKKKVIERSVSSPAQQPTGTSGVKRSESFPAPSPPQLDTQQTHPKQFNVPGPVKDESGRVDADATAQNVIQQLNALVLGSSKAAGSAKALEKGFIRLDPKSLGVMFTQVLSQSLAAENMKSYAVKLDTEGRQALDAVHQDMQKKADSLIADVLKAYPKLDENLAREDKQAISRDAQTAAFRTMQKEVWSTAEVQVFAENVEPDLERLALWAETPEVKPKIQPQFKPMVAQKPSAHSPEKGIRERTTAQVGSTPKSFVKAKETAKSKAVEARTIKPVSHSTTSSIYRPRKQSFVPVRSEVIPQKPGATKKKLESGVEKPVQESAQPKKPVDSPVPKTVAQTAPSRPDVITPEAKTVSASDTDEPNIAGELQDSIRVIGNLRENELKPQLSENDTGVAIHLFVSLVDKGATEVEAHAAALAYRDAVVDQKLTSDQALTVGIEVYNWITDEQAYGESDVVEAGKTLASWLAAGESEISAVEALTQWLDETIAAADDESWEEEWGIEPDNSEPLTQPASDQAPTEAPAPPPPPPPPIPSPPSPASLQTTGNVVDPKIQERFASDSRQDLLAAIRERQGKPIQKDKSVGEEKPVQEQASSDSRQDLLAAIRAQQGKPVRKANSTGSEQPTNTEQDKKAGSKGEVKSKYSEGGDAVIRALKSRVSTEAAEPQRDLTESFGGVFEEFFFESGGELDPESQPQLREDLKLAIENTGIAVDVEALSQSALNQLIVSIHGKQGEARHVIESAISDWISERLFPGSE
ncbi:hypothetical protein [Parendozoicomonas sp. Alg238-R29]|uniref:hypothetical protein n=1 Tax=Parendozoicomonas sp. Alg238-R29 TaxID=2993446 RepID=UPI00248DD472|nr:hypothetical protein [Parendozoicomonas sp. Alg238-R29]